MSRKLSELEIKKRLERGRNYERLYFERTVERDQLKAEIEVLKEQNRQKDKTIEDLSARIDQLETMLFGTGNGGSEGHTYYSPLPKATTKAKQHRTTSSYARPIPPEAEITAERYHDIHQCPHCQGQLTDFTEVSRFEEDINLPILDALIAKKDASPVDTKPTKTVIRHIVRVGYCPSCGNYCSARDLRGANVTIGPNVRSLVTYLSTMNDNSYSQIINLLLQCFGFNLSSGEISNILDDRRSICLPEYNHILDAIRAGPVHMDETSLPIQSQKGAGYAHVMVSAITEDTIFKLADNRGKGNSKALIGEEFSGTGITDRYGSYKHLFEPGKHQICWAHLTRNARDISRLQSLPKDKTAHTKRYYAKLQKVYKQIRKTKAKPFDQKEREDMVVQLTRQIERMNQPHKLDPKQLIDLKAGILEYKDCLFVCLMDDTIPPDNNKAERALRKLVIKRKKSFGVKTKKGARTLEVLMSIAQTFQGRYGNDCFVRMHELALSAEFP